MEASSEEVQAFLVEADEGLAQLDQELVALECSPNDREVLDRSFRVVHSIKGACGFLGLKSVVKVAHAGESLLARLRDGKILLDAPRSTLLFRMVDDIRRSIAAFKESGDKGQFASDALVVALQAAAEAAPAVAEAAPAVAVQPEAGSVEHTPAAGPGETSIRVDITRLDQIVNLVGELVLVRNQITQQVSDGQLPSSETVQRLKGVTVRLQDGVLKVRMQPVGKLFSSLPRVVRDVASQLGKDVALLIEGAETELDRSVIETVRDPLIHVVRNALDHGLERPEDRLRAGKPTRGLLRLRSWHEGGLVHIAVEDDGAGINLERVRSKALERGLLDPDRASTVSEPELLEMIFLPGFSTAQEVTNLSGRGVGMDVVRAALDRVGGSVRLTTRPGAGTTLVMTMPLMLAIVSALMVRVGGDRYAIPRVSIDEVARVDRLESFHGVPVLRLRETLIPLAHLGRVLGLQGASDPSRLAGNAVIVRGDGRVYGLVVDEVLDIEEIVVKPLPRWFRAPRTFAGLTILGDGSVAVILDIAGISRRAGIAAAISSGKLPTEVRPSAPQVAQGEPVIVVADGRGGRQAFPLSQVIRIEQVARSSLERVDGRPVLQHRGRVLPVIDLCPWAPPRDPMSVLLTTLDDRPFALLVDEVLDIALAAAPAEISPQGPGIVVVNGQVAGLQDLRAVMRREMAGAFSLREAAA